MKNLVLALFFICNLATSARAQNYEKLFTLPMGESRFTTDPIGNIYLFSQGDITKLDRTGKEAGKYSTREFGDISYVDASNPMKILVVFAAFSKAVILDAGMASNSTFDLNIQGAPFVKLICTSRSDGYWIFDPVAKKIKRINDQSGILQEGTELRQISEDPLEPVWIGDSGKWLLLNVPDYGILVFDSFGTYFKTLRPGTKGQIQASGDEVLYKEGDRIQQISISSGITKTFIIPENEASDEFRIEGNRLLISHQKNLTVYSY
ncbi:MAG: hypothetical protein KBH11_13075 [Bacteroidia bacterium]|nr:hypothetical protein [Bacteroidota bacterium]MBP9084006.1 hypothetical protein [Bacteroidia bacterium]